MIHLKNAYGMLKSCLDEAIKIRKKKELKEKKKKRWEKNPVCRTEKLFNCFSVILFYFTRHMKLQF